MKLLDVGWLPQAFISKAGVYSFQDPMVWNQQNKIKHAHLL